MLGGGLYKNTNVYTSVLIINTILLLAVVTYLIWSTINKHKTTHTESFVDNLGTVSTDDITTMQNVMPVEQLNNTFVTIDSLKQTVNDFIPNGIICMWAGNQAPSGWVLCNGQNNTPDLRGRFILGHGGANTLDIGNTNEPVDYSNEVAIKLSADNLPAHKHPIFGFITQPESNRKRKAAIHTMKFTQGPYRRTPHNRISGFSPASTFNWDKDPIGDPTEENVTANTPISIPKVPFYVLAYIMYVGTNTNN